MKSSKSKLDPLCKWYNRERVSCDAITVLLDGTDMCAKAPTLSKSQTKAQNFLKL
jgi:hypothetical protein